MLTPSLGLRVQGVLLHPGLKSGPETAKLQRSSPTGLDIAVPRIWECIGPYRKHPSNINRNRTSPYSDDKTDALATVLVIESGGLFTSFGFSCLLSVSSPFGPCIPHWLLCPCPLILTTLPRRGVQCITIKLYYRTLGNSAAAYSKPYIELSDFCAGPTLFSEFLQHS